MRLTEVPAAPTPARRIGARELAAEFLLATADLPLEEAARIAGVGVPTLRRWERSGVKQLNGPVRRRLLMYLAKQALEAR